MTAHLFKCWLMIIIIVRLISFTDSCYNIADGVYSDAHSFTLLLFLNSSVAEAASGNRKWKHTADKAKRVLLVFD